MKSFGVWRNIGDCVPKNRDDNGKPCGIGQITQHRVCINGTLDGCRPNDNERTVDCDEAGKPLPSCHGKLYFEYFLSASSPFLIFKCFSSTTSRIFISLRRHEFYGI